MNVADDIPSYVNVYDNSSIEFTHVKQIDILVYQSVCNLVQPVDVTGQPSVVCYAI